jgi:hypothetical protein
MRAQFQWIRLHLARVALSLETEAQGLPWD